MKAFFSLFIIFSCLCLATSQASAEDSQASSTTTNSSSSDVPECEKAVNTTSDQTDDGLFSPYFEQGLCYAIQGALEDAQSAVNF